MRPWTLKLRLTCTQLFNRCVHSDLRALQRELDALARRLEETQAPVADARRKAPIKGGYIEVTVKEIV